MSSKVQAKKRAVFLDRDGTINREIFYLSSVRRLRLLPGAARAIRQLNRLGFAVIVITNQGGPISRGGLTEKNLDRIHAIMVQRLARGGARLDGIYYCPHHPESEIRRYRILCHCRKPRPGMIIKALKERGIGARGSFFVGDRTADMLAGKRAKLKTILVETGAGGKDGAHRVSPDFVAKNLFDAVGIIKKHA